MQRLVIMTALLAATWTAPASAGWYGLGNTNTYCGSAHGFAHQLHGMTPEQLWAGYCQEQACRGCRHQGFGCGPAECGCNACGSDACECGVTHQGVRCHTPRRNHAAGLRGRRHHRGGLPEPSACAECAEGQCTCSTAPPNSATIADSEQTSVADYGDTEPGDDEPDSEDTEAPNLLPDIE